MSNLSVRNDTSVHTVFPVEDLQFAMAWSRVAPGFGGWKLAVSEMTTGELVEVTPPGAEFPVFYVLPRPEGTEIIRERVIEVGGGQVSEAMVPSLRDAVLLLCPLSSEGMEQVQHILQQDMFHRAN